MHRELLTPDQRPGHDKPPPALAQPQAPGQASPDPQDLLTPLWRPDAVLRLLDMAGWRNLMAQAQSCQMTARLGQRLQALGVLDQVPQRPREMLGVAQAAVERQRVNLRSELAQLRKALAGLGQPVVLLKGAAYAAAGLPPGQDRRFGDIDLLVPQHVLPQVESALFGAGWIPQERDAYNDRYYRQWMHELPPLTHVHRGTVLDVHHTITPPTSAFNVDGAGLIAGSVPIPGDALFRMLAPEDMVLHSAVHLFGEGEFGHGLRDLLDMQRLIDHFSAASPMFWPRLVLRAGDLRLGVPLHHALQQLQRLCGLVPPAEVQPWLRQQRPRGLSAELMPRLLARALAPRHPSCGRPGDGLARWLLYVRSHALRMPPHLLLPHLLRKSWMQHFPDKPKAPGPAQAGQA